MSRNNEIELLRNRNTELEKKLENRENQIFKLKQMVKEIEEDKKILYSKLKEKKSEIEVLKNKITQINNKNSRKALEYLAKIKSLTLDTSKLSDTINLKDLTINDLDNKVPRIYNFRAYYYKEIRQHIPGKILRKRTSQKDYLDSNLDYAKYVKSIYLKFNINTKEFFKLENDKLISIELYTSSGKILKQEISLSKNDNMYESEIFKNLILKKGDFVIKVSYYEEDLRIEEYEFTLI